MSEKNPQLRSDLKISRHVQKDGIHYVIKDPMAQEYFRFPEEEYTVVAMFDGSNSLNEIVTKYNRNNPEGEIDLELVKQFFDTLDKAHLLQKSLAEQNLFMLEKMREQRKSNLLGAKGSLMYFRISLLDPDNLLNKIYPSVKWIFKPPFLVFASLCVLIAVIIIGQNYDRFLEGMSSIITFSDKTPMAIFGLWLTVIIIIFFHELGHAFTCKHFGGEVHEMGILMLFFMPCFFANVNDAWTFEKKYQKLLVTFAGGLVEFFIGSIATFLWILLNPASVACSISYQVMTVCAFSSVMFNFNPLMKLDGYYAFSDFVSIPNLKAESGSYVKFIVQKYLFRLSPEDTFDTYTIREKRILFFYGVAATIYITGVMLGLFFMARGMLIDKLGAIGSILSLFVAWKLFKGHIMKFIGFCKTMYAEKIVLVKLHPIVSGTVLVLLIGAGIYGFSTQTLIIEKSCTLLPVHITKVFAGESGFLKEHTIHSGSTIGENEKVGMLHNSDKEEELHILKVRHDMEKIKKSTAMKANDFRGSRKAGIAINRIANDMERTKHELAACTLSSPRAGIIVSSQTEKGYRPYFSKGSELYEIADLDSFKIEVSLLESEIGDISVGDRAEVRLWSHMDKKLTGIIKKIAPVAMTYEDENTKNEGVENEFAVTVSMTNIPSKQLQPYMTGSVRIFAGDIRGLRLIMKMIRSALRADLFF